MPAPLNGLPTHSNAPALIMPSSLCRASGQINSFGGMSAVTGRAHGRLAPQPSFMLSHSRGQLKSGGVQEPMLWGRPLLRLSSLAQSGRSSSFSMRASNSDELPSTEIGEGEEDSVKATELNGQNNAFGVDVINRLKSFVADPSQPVSSDDYSCYLNFYGLDAATEGTDRQFDSIVVGDDHIAMQSFLQPEGRSTGDVICVHGYHDHSGVYTDIVSNAVKQGKNVYLFDFQGHGLSTASMGACGVSSFSKYFDVLDAVLEKVSEKRGLADIGDNVDFIAHSTGASVVSSRLLDGKKNRAVLLGPLFRNGNFDRSRRAYNIAVKQAERRKQSVDEVSKPSMVAGVDTTNKAYSEFAQQDPLRGRFLTASWFGSLLEWQEAFLQKAPSSEVKPLILQGENDAVVDGPYNRERFEEKFQGADIRILPGVGHQIMNERPEVVDRVNQMINKFLS